MAPWLGVDPGAMVRQFVARRSRVTELGTLPPAHLLSDEKFSMLNGERIYLFLVSEQELIWGGQGHGEGG